MIIDSLYSLRRNRNLLFQQSTDLKIYVSLLKKYCQKHPSLNPLALSINVRRSGKTFENLTMQVAWTTPLKKLDALEKCLNNWLSMEENRWFEPSTNITLQNIQFQRYLELTIGIGHNG